jgi:hypothetical protein
MGSPIEINDTLQLSIEQGFPADLLNREKHTETPVRLASLTDRTFEFKNKDDARLFHLDPVRVFLVENIGGKWLFWGKVLIQSQTISKKLASDGSWKHGDWTTSGTYKIIDLYDPEYQEQFTQRESPSGKSYF